MMYTKVFIEFYNWCSSGLIHKTHRIVQLEKYPISRAENPSNLGGQRFYKIFEVLQRVPIKPRVTKENTFYLHNYIDWIQFHQLYNPKWQTKGTQSINAIVWKLMPVSRKEMEQKPETGVRATWMKAPKRMENDLLDLDEQIIIILMRHKIASLIVRSIYMKWRI